MTYASIQFESPSRTGFGCEFLVDLGDFPGTISINMDTDDAAAWANVPVESVKELRKALKQLLPRAEAGETREWL